MAAISVDPPRATAILQAELYLPYDLLCDTDRQATRDWGLLNERERGGVPIPAIFAIGHDRTVLAHSIDSMTRQVGPQEFLATIEQSELQPARRHFLFPRILEYLRVGSRVRR